jgi:hypothetical protein
LSYNDSVSVFIWATLNFTMPNLNFKRNQKNYRFVIIETRRELSGDFKPFFRQSQPAGNLRGGENRRNESLHSGGPPKLPVSGKLFPGDGAVKL